MPAGGCSVCWIASETSEYSGVCGRVVACSSCLSSTDANGYALTTAGVL